MFLVIFSLQFLFPQSSIWKELVLHKSNTLACLMNQLVWMEGNSTISFNSPGQSLLHWFLERQSKYLRWLVKFTEFWQTMTWDENLCIAWSNILQYCVIRWWHAQQNYASNIECHKNILPPVNNIWRWEY